MTTIEVTNQVLNALLRLLHFECIGRVPPNHALWRHSQSGCEFLLPANKVEDSARPADIVAIRSQLERFGHLAEGDFEAKLLEASRA